MSVNNLLQFFALWFQEKIDKTLVMLQNADPTGESCPDPPELPVLEGKSSVVYFLAEKSFFLLVGSNIRLIYHDVSRNGFYNADGFTV